MAREKEILNLNENSAPPGDAPTETIEDIIARGAAAATEPGSATDTASIPEVGTKPRRKYSRRKKADELSPEEEQAKRDLEVFFSPAGVGKVFTHGVNGFYITCGAVPLTPEEDAMLATAFAAWAKFRLPASSESYQPDMLLAVSLIATTLPRMQPIAEHTAPWWKRLFAKLKPRPRVKNV